MKKVSSHFMLVEEDIDSIMLENELEKQLADFKTNLNDALSFE